MPCNEPKDLPFLATNQRRKRRVKIGNFGNLSKNVGVEIHKILEHLTNAERDLQPKAAFPFFANNFCLKKVDQSMMQRFKRCISSCLGTMRFGKKNMRSSIVTSATCIFSLIGNINEKRLENTPAIWDSPDFTMTRHDQVAPEAKRSE